MKCNVSDLLSFFDASIACENPFPLPNGSGTLGASCGASRAGVPGNGPYVPGGRYPFITNVVYRNNRNDDACPPVPLGPE